MQKYNFISIITTNKDKNKKQVQKYHFALFFFQ